MTFVNTSAPIAEPVDSHQLLGLYPSVSVRRTVP